MEIETWSHTFEHAGEKMTADMRFTRQHCVPTFFSLSTPNFFYEEFFFDTTIGISGASLLLSPSVLQNVSVLLSPAALSSAPPLTWPVSIPRRPQRLCAPVAVLRSVPCSMDERRPLPSRLCTPPRRGLGSLRHAARFAPDACVYSRTASPFSLHRHFLSHNLADFHTHM